jgi:hypothetical protein
MSTDKLTPDSFAGDIAGASDTPDVIEATRTARRGDPVLGPALYPNHGFGRGVEWVRPTDLMVRSASRVVGAGIDFHADMARRSRRAAAIGTGALAERARRLPPVAAFGRGRADRSMSRDAVGMT